MKDFPSAIDGLGMCREGGRLLFSAVSWKNNEVKLEWKHEILIEEGKTEDVKRLYTFLKEDERFKKAFLDAVTVAVVPGSLCLVRTLFLQIKKDKDIEAVLPFELEPSLPYPVEEGIVDKITLGRRGEGTDVAAFFIKKETLLEELEKWQSLGIEPEAVSCAPICLSNLSTHLFPGNETFFAAYLGETETCLTLIVDGLFFTSQTAAFGIKQLKNALKKESPKKLEEVSKEEFSKEAYPLLMEAASQWQNDLLRMLYGLEKGAKGKEIKGLFLTGPGKALAIFPKLFDRSLGFSLMEMPQESNASWHPFSLSIGAAIAALPKQKEQVNFRQKELAFPDPWKRLKQPIKIYLLLCFLLSLSLYFYTQVYAGYRLDEVRQNYAYFLGALKRPFKTVEKEYALKTGASQAVSIKELSENDLKNRLNYLEDAAKAQPELFPLFPNVPTVSDVLAWLSTHPKARETPTSKDGLHLESFSYVLLKRPEQAKKTEKYQVKVEFEFTSPTPKLAREFHDSLISPNDFVDPKAEVKWSSGQGKYRTSFYLKDKTVYPR